MQTTATLTHCVEIPVAHGAALYDVEVEAEIVSDDTRPNGYSVVAVSLDTLADIQPKRGRRWSYVEIGSYRDARYHGGIGPEVQAPTPLAKALTAAIADTLEKSAAFAAKAHDALQEAEYGARDQAAYDRREFNTAAE